MHYIKFCHLYPLFFGAQLHCIRNNCLVLKECCSQNQQLENGRIKVAWTACTWVGCKMLVPPVTGLVRARASTPV